MKGGRANNDHASPLRRAFFFGCAFFMLLLFAGLVLCQ